MMAINKNFVRPDHMFTDIAEGFKSIFVSPSPNRGYTIRVKTRDFKEASSDCHVYCAILSQDGSRTVTLLLDNLFRDDMENGEEDIFQFSKLEHLSDVASLELWRESKRQDDAWFCEYVTVSHMRCDKNDAAAATPPPSVTYAFPCHQWIKLSKRYELFVNNSMLPQLETLPRRIQHRREHLYEAKNEYRYEAELTGYPRRAAQLPIEETESTAYLNDMGKMKKRMYVEKKILDWFVPGEWDSFEDMLSLFKNLFGIPKGYYDWKSDRRFGEQRLVGVNPMQLKRCDEIHSNFPVTDAMVAEFIENQSLDDVIAQQRLFIVDYQWLKGVPVQEGFKMAAPIALFYAHTNGDLLPIAIQLFPDPADDNPIFLPSDPEYTWMLAKMWFNHAEANVHEANAHLGFTHLVVEAVCCAVHQALSTCHPVFQLFGPHFLYLLSNNSNGINKLVGVGDEPGYFAITMTMGKKGFDEILKRGWKEWRFDKDGWFPADIERRGVGDKDILPGYYARDDCLMVHQCIVDYVTEVLETVYDSPEKLREDYEIQEFASILVDEKNGPGFKGMFGDGKFENLEDLVKVVSATIFISSVTHAMVNFGQYDEYAFSPNFPAKLTGEVLKDKHPRTEADIIAHLPDKDTALASILVVHLLSMRNTESLGSFEVQYMYEPKAVQAVERFQESLKKVGEIIDERNKTVKTPYTMLHPSAIPNACSI